jgi:nucleotide-binding universal stress UspA family protein
MSDLPVFVHKHRRPSPGTEGMSVLYATNFTATDADISPYLCFPGLRAERLHLLHVGQRAPDPDAERRRVEEVEENLARLADEFSGNYGHIDEKATVGIPRREIVGEARRVNADLIVLGKADTSGTFGAVLGSTAEEMPHTSRCSVLIIPRRQSA